MTYSFDTQKLIDFCKSHDVSMLSVFGSTARGETREDSDLDLLVRFSNRISLLKVVKLEREMSEVVGRKVDLVTEAALSPYLRERIMKERQILYGT